MMKPCDNWAHEEIMYSGSSCPLCAALEEVLDLKQDLDICTKQLASTKK